MVERFNRRLGAHLSRTPQNRAATTAAFPAMPSVLAGHNTAADARIVRRMQFVVNLVELELLFRWKIGILMAASLCPPTMRIGLLDRHTGRLQKPRSSPTGAFLHPAQDGLVRGADRSLK